MALAWGMVELAAKSLVARFAGRLCLAGLFVVAAVILATDVLSARGFTQQWPAARDHFQYVSLSLLALVAAAVVLTLIVALITTGLRSRHNPAWRGPLVAVALAGVAALATQGLLATLPANVAYPALTLVAAVAAWLAASQAAKVNVGQIRAGASGPGGPRPAAGTWLRRRRLTGSVPRWLPPLRRQRGLRRVRQQRVRHRGLPLPRASPTAPPGTAGAGEHGAAGYGGAEGRGAAGYADTGGFQAGGYPGPGGFPPEDTGGFHADPVEPVTGAFDPLFRPNASSAPGQAAGRPGGDAATLNRAARR